MARAGGGGGAGGQAGGTWLRNSFIPRGEIFEKFTAIHSLFFLTLQMDNFVFKQLYNFMYLKIVLGLSLN